MNLAVPLLALIAAAAPPRDTSDPDLLEDPPSALSESEDRPTAALPSLTLSRDDRIKSVQRKPFLKQGRLELTPLGFAVLNNAFFPKVGGGIRLGYHVRDSLAFGIAARQFSPVPSTNVRLAKRQLQARIESAEPRYDFDAAFFWTPIYGKVALFDSIHHFDLYLTGGVGAIQSRGSGSDGLHASTHLGIGQRFSLTDFLVVDLSVLETLYSDRPASLDKSQLQHDLSVQLGLGIFFPFSFAYREP